MSNNNSLITIDVTGSNANLQSTVTSIAPAGSVQYQTVSNTWQSLLAVHTALQGDLSSLNAQGIKLVGFGTDATKNREVLQVVDPTTAQIAQLQADYGSGHITIEPTVPNSTTPLDAHTNRESDTNPFYGGDNMEVTDSGGTSRMCSSGFGVTIGGVDAILTAGHCWPLDVVALNYLVDSSDTTHGSGNSMGDVEAIDTSLTASTGTAYTDGASSDNIWGGAIGSPSTEIIHGFRGVVNGDSNICSKGSYTGQVCNLTVGVTNNCEPGGYYYNDSSYDKTSITICDLIYVKNTALDGSGHHLPVYGEGDSGGPLTVAFQSNLYGVGMIQLGVNTATCPSPNDFTWRTCFWDGYYSSLGVTLTKWDATLKTG
jgi:hypothetical protein